MKKEAGNLCVDYRYKMRIRERSFWKTTQLINERDMEFEKAVKCAEIFAKSKVQYFKGDILSKNAKWLRTPASEKQLELLRKYSIDVENSGPITKGQASTIITYIGSGIAGENKDKAKGRTVEDFERSFLIPNRKKSKTDVEIAL